MPANAPIPPQPEQEPQGIEDIFEHEDKGVVPAPERRESQTEFTRETAPETKPEQRPETTPESEQARQQFAPPTPPTPPAPKAAKSPMAMHIESILSENLEELYLKMTPQEQMMFQVEGERAATKIEQLLQEAKVKIREVLSIIRNWLQLIPGVNKFFLEQEAKIKTDRLLSLHEQKQKHIQR